MVGVVADEIFGLSSSNRTAFTMVVPIYCAPGVVVLLDKIYSVNGALCLCLTIKLVFEDGGDDVTLSL